MNWKTILKIQGFILIILSLMMLLPGMYSLIVGSGDFFPLLWGMLITLSVGLLLALLIKPGGEVRAREGFVIVTLGWIFATTFGAIPFYIEGTMGGYINCVFETMSGFTTTGATILTDIESMPEGLLLWRSMTHWLGGMGIILLTIALLPIFGIQYGKMFNAEIPGPTKDRLSPRIKNTAKILWLIYGGMTVLETILLMFGGMSFFDAICHTFGTLATGGFSTKNLSVGAYNSLYIEVVIIFFMYLAGINFALHFQLLKGNLKDFFKNREWQVYTIILLSAVLVISFNLFFSNDINLEQYDYYPKALRDSFFQVFSITTTTGFTTADFDLWTPFARILLILLMFIGGSAGSTGGGIKQVRFMIIIKSAYTEMKKLFYPSSVFKVKIAKRTVEDKVIKNVMGFFILFILIFGAVTLFLTLQGYDLVTSFSASIATLGNIGPGLAKVGAIENYAFFDPVSKIVLTLSMLIGRLEIYSVLILIFALLNPKK